MDVVWVRIQSCSNSSKSSKIYVFFTPKHVGNFTQMVFYSHSLKSKNLTKNQTINMKISSLKAIGNYNI